MEQLNPIETKLKEIFSKSYFLFSKDIERILYVDRNKDETHDNFYLNKSQTDLVKTYIESNLKILIYTFTSKKKTALTIPGVIEKDVLSTFSGISDIVNSNMNLYRINLKGEVKDNKIIVTSKIPNKILPIFIEKSLLTHFKERELIAIYLHEIGHWVNYRLYFPRTLLGSLYELQHIFLNPYLFGGLIIGGGGIYSYVTDSGALNTFGYFILFFILTGICLTSLISAINIKNEYDSDSFAKKMGFGPELQSILNKKDINDFPLKLNNELPISSLTKSSIIMFSLLSPILYSLFWYFRKDPEDSIESHPESHHRVKVLMSESLNYVNSNSNLIHQHFNKFDIQLFTESVKNFDKLDNVNFNGMLSSFGNLYTSYDDFIYTNQKSIFPHKLVF